MKKWVLLSAVFMMLNLYTFSQKTEKPTITRTWVTMMDSSQSSGLLYKTNDFSIMITPRIDFENEMNTFSFDQIKLIRLQRENKKSSMLFGIIVGGTIGLITGYSLGDTEGLVVNIPKEFKATTGAIGGAACGALISGLSGSIKIKIPIDGNKNKFDQERNRLIKYSYNKQHY